MWLKLCDLKKIVDVNFFIQKKHLKSQYQTRDGYGGEWEIYSKQTFTEIHYVADVVVVVRYKLSLLNFSHFVDVNRIYKGC